METIENIDKIHEDFIIKIGKSNKDFNQKLYEYILENLDNGKIPKGDFLATLEKEIRQILSNSGYVQLINQFLGNGDLIKKDLVKLYGESKVKSIFDKSERYKFFLNLNEDNLKGTGVNENVVKNIANKIRVGAFTDVGLTAIKEIVKNTSKVLPRYVNQVSYDTLGQITGSLQADIFEKFKPTKGRYVGSLIETSRPICSHLIKMGNPISREQLTKVLDKYCPKGKPDLVLGRGMIEGTNIDNFSINKGGYQCRHIWIWIIEK
jgi:hypothetical protein